MLETGNAGTLFIDSCTTPDAMDDSIRRKAVNFARKDRVLRQGYL